jgi:hypothetical protein
MGTRRVRRGTREGARPGGQPGGPVLLDLDIATTARLLGIAPGTVGAHLSRAVATLRAALPLDTGVIGPAALDGEGAAGPVPADDQLTTGQEAIR